MSTLQDLFSAVENFGFKVRQIIEGSNGFITIVQLKDAGFTLQELIDDGYIKKIKNAGFKAMQIVEEVRGNTGELLKDAGFTLQELQEEGLTDTFYEERRIRERLKTREKIGGRKKF